MATEKELQIDHGVEPQDERTLGDLEERVKKLEEMLGGIGQTPEGTDLRGKSLEISGAGNARGATLLPLEVFDGNDVSKKRKVAAFGMGKTVDESQIFAAITAGKNSDEEANRELEKPLNTVDWTKVNYALIRAQHDPGQAASGNLPPFLFFLIERTPTVTDNPTGIIVSGENTIKDTSAKFQANAFVNCILNIYNSAGVVLESHKISSNTATVITVDGTWGLDSGTYIYEVRTPGMLGSADLPVVRGYFGDELRLGYGPSGSARWIRWGNGTPESNVTANAGSLYLRFDGGANESLYVKESGEGNTGWKALVTKEYVDNQISTHSH